MDKELENMTAGKPHRPDMVQESIAHQAHKLSQKYNAIPDTETEKRNEIVDKLLGAHGKGTYLQGPIYFDYGINTKVGKNFYSNFNLTVLDTCPVTIGDNVMIGPNTTIATPIHPLLPDQRNDRIFPDGTLSHYEYGAPITIGDNCWLASNVTVCPGVTIGDNCVIGAGSVVTRDIPDNSLAVGTPAKVIRQITEADRIQDWPY